MGKLRFLLVALLVCAFVGTGSFANASVKKVSVKKVKAETVTYTGVVSSINGTDIILKTKVKSVPAVNKTKTKEQKIKKQKNSVAAETVALTVHTVKAQFKFSSSRGSMGITKAGGKKVKTGDNVSGLKVGDSVTIAGIKESDGTITARRIQLKKAKVEKKILPGSKLLSESGDKKIKNK